MMGANSAEDTQSPNLEQQKKVAGNNSSSPSDPDIIGWLFHTFFLWGIHFHLLFIWSVSWECGHFCETSFTKTL